MKKWICGLTTALVLSALLWPSADAANPRNRSKLGYRGRATKQLVGRQPSGMASLNTSLVAYYKLNEPSGNRADSTAAGLTLTDNATVTTASGIQATAAQFTAANSEYLSSSSGSFYRTGDYAFSFWFYLDSFGTTRTLFSKYDPSISSNRAYLVQADQATSKVKFFAVVSGPTEVSVTATTPNITTATWYHVVVQRVQASNQISVQVNNGTVYTASLTGTNQSSSSNFQIGRYDGASFWMDGRVDELGYWSRTLTAAEVTRLYNNGAGVTYPNF